jgi:alkyldihydroxyacetonephosphate synthase
VPTRSWWGWGNEEDAFAGRELSSLAETVGRLFGTDGRLRQPPTPESLGLRAPRLAPPSSLEGLIASDARSRACHSYGKSYTDVVRALAGRVDHPPDLVAYPRAESDVEAVLDWCSSVGAALIPYGGGSSVVGGVEPDVGDDYAAAVTLDLSLLADVVEVDALSLAARIQGGALGPSLESRLRPHGLTLRHFPQSFEFSSLGGWLATRSGGHFATGPTHIDDLVESIRLVAPSGVVETRRLPGSGAGPSPDRLFLGSEGVLGVITEAWMRVRPRPRWRAGGSARFDSFASGARCVRALAQSGLSPSNCRLVDALEASVNGVGDGSHAVLVVGFESADHPLAATSKRALELVGDNGGVVDAATWRDGSEAADIQSVTVEGEVQDAATAWRSAFMRAPYLRDALVRLGVMCETFETAITWDRFEALHAAVTQAVRDALTSVGGGKGFVTCRTTHAYPDGVAPYFTVLAPARTGAEIEQWATVKEVASDAVLGSGGTITHHHAVGRDHRRWYDRQRPDLFAAAVAAAKSVMDPRWVCNPGVLVDRPG